MKKILFGFCFILFGLISTMFVKAEDISVVYNGEMLWFDVPPQMINERVMVPMRTIFETIGATVEWDEASQSVKAIDGKTIVSFKIDDDFIYTNDTRVQLDSKIIKINDRTFVPVRAIAEAFDNNVFWSSDLNRVLITDYTISDLFDEPIFIVEELFGGDYEINIFTKYNYEEYGIIYYEDNRVPCRFTYGPTRNEIYMIDILGFCKIANGLYYSVSEPYFYKKGIPMFFGGNDAGGVIRTKGTIPMQGTYKNQELALAIHLSNGQYSTPTECLSLWKN